MSVLADIKTLEELVAELMQGMSAPPDGGDDGSLHDAAVKAIIELLDEADITLEQLIEPEMLQQIQEAIDLVFQDWEVSLRKQIAETVQSIAEATEKFYKSRGIQFPGLRRAAERSKLAQELSEALNEGMKNIRQQLAEVTHTQMVDQILAGEINTDALADAIQITTKTSTRFARTQARAAVNGFNQVHRNLIAERAKLDHFHYYGSLQINSRPFCRIHIGYIFHTDRINQMRNGMLEPMLIFKGGFNCRHSWLPVDPSWSAEILAKVVDEEPTVVFQGAASNSPITVIASTGRIARIEAQMPLQRRGFSQFIDAESNDTGYVAIHNDWHNARLSTRAGTKLRAAFDEERAEAIRQAEGGAQVRLELTPDAQLTAEERWALKDYTKSDFATLNRDLRDGFKLQPAQQEFADNISSALAKIPAEPGPVYRGIHFETFDEWDQAYASMNHPIFSTSAFMSTSRSKHQAEQFIADRPYGILVTVPNPHSGRPIGKYSAFPPEEEVLFDIGTRFRKIDSTVGENVAHVTLQELL